MHVSRIVDSRADSDQLAGHAQLLDDGRRNAEAAGEGVDSRRLHARAAQPDEESLDTLTHLRIEEGLMSRQPYAVSPSNELAGGDELIDHGTHRIVAEEQSTGTSMAAGSRIVGLGAHTCDQRINPRIGGQRLATVDPSQRGQEATRSEPPLGGVDRPFEWLV